MAIIYIGVHFNLMRMERGAGETGHDTVRGGGEDELKAERKIGLDWNLA